MVGAIKTASPEVLRISGSGSGFLGGGARRQWRGLVAGAGQGAGGALGISGGCRGDGRRDGRGAFALHCRVGGAG
jgi:hypothetical protein